MYSAAVAANSSPDDTAMLNDSPRSLCNRAEKAEPEWLTNAMGPGRSSFGS